MALKDIVKVNRRTYFNPRGWLGYDNVKAQSVFLYGFIRRLFSPEVPEREETFEEAVKRLHLSHKAIEETKQSYLIYSMVFLSLASLVFIFGFFLLFVHHTWAGWLIALAVATLLGTQAFRYNFFYFQMKWRKLGCTFEEWKRGKPFDREEPPP